LNWWPFKGIERDLPVWWKILAAMLEIVLQLAGREQIIAGKALFDARNVLADMLAQIDLWMNVAGRPR
jgi:hypothetical protein